MKTKSKQGITIKTTCSAIQDANKVIERAQADRDILIAAAIQDFELDGIKELEKVYSKYYKAE